jgi:hypothetical protein
MNPNISSLVIRKDTMTMRSFHILAFLLAATFAQSAMADDIDEGCTIVGRVSVEACTNPATPLILIAAGIEVPPAALAVAAACQRYSGPAQRPLLEKLVIGGCKCSLKKIGDEYEITVSTARRNANELAQVWKCFEGGGCVNWVLINIQ